MGVSGHDGGGLGVDLGILEVFSSINDFMILGTGKGNWCGVWIWGFPPSLGLARGMGSCPHGSAAQGVMQCCHSGAIPQVSWALSLEGGVLGASVCFTESLGKKICNKWAITSSTAQVKAHFSGHPAVTAGHCSPHSDVGHYHCHLNSPQRALQSSAALPVVLPCLFHTITL